MDRRASLWRSCLHLGCRLLHGMHSPRLVFTLSSPKPVLHRTLRGEFAVYVGIITSVTLRALLQSIVNTLHYKLVDRESAGRMACSQAGGNEQRVVLLYEQ